MGSVPGSGRYPGGRNGNRLQYFCLENSMDRTAWQTTVQGVTKELDMTEQLSVHAHVHTHTPTHTSNTSFCNLHDYCTTVHFHCTNVSLFHKAVHFCFFALF